MIDKLLDLAFVLWENQFETFDEVYKILKSYGEMKSWTKETLQAKLRDWKPLAPGVQPSVEKNEKNMELLGEQITLYTPEYGEEISSAGLAILENDQEILHRIWRAQAELVLPLIDDTRIKVSRILEKRLQKTG